MYVTLYAADSQQIVLDTIKDTENAKPLFINHYTFEGNKTSVITKCWTVSRKQSLKTCCVSSSTSTSSTLNQGKLTW